jgi:hypothetical protein
MHHVANKLDLRRLGATFCQQSFVEKHMQKPCCKIELIVRTIGAERGRAARGRPEQG